MKVASYDVAFAGTPLKLQMRIGDSLAEPLEFAEVTNGQVAQEPLFLMNRETAEIEFCPAMERLVEKRIGRLAGGDAGQVRGLAAMTGRAGLGLIGSFFTGIQRALMIGIVNPVAGLGALVAAVTVPVILGMVFVQLLPVVGGIAALLVAWAVYKTLRRRRNLAAFRREWDRLIPEVTAMAVSHLELDLQNGEDLVLRLKRGEDLLPVHVFAGETGLDCGFETGADSWLFAAVSPANAFLPASAPARMKQQHERAITEITGSARTLDFRAPCFVVDNLKAAATIGLEPGGDLGLLLIRRGLALPFSTGGEELFLAGPEHLQHVEVIPGDDAGMRAAAGALAAAMRAGAGMWSADRDMAAFANSRPVRVYLDALRGAGVLPAAGEPAGLGGGLGAGLGTTVPTGPAAD